ncbi:MAG: DASH family cryptochrome [Spirosomataceae bacterium]
MKNIVLWFRNDLRLHDNQAWERAAQLGQVVPVFIIDDRWMEEGPLGFRRVEAHRMKFILESVQALRQTLQERGSNLLVQIGKPEEIIPALAKQIMATHVVASKEITQEETDVETALSQRLKPLNVDIELIWQRSLYHVRDLPFQINFLPDIFTEFRKKVERTSKIRPTTVFIPNPIALDLPWGDMPTLESLGYGMPDQDARGVLAFKGGEKEGLARLRYYLDETQLLKTYKETRNGLLGGDYSSKFSPWLALGCLSPRHVYEEVKRFEAHYGANESTYWLIFELLWRDYFIFISLRYGSRIFKLHGIKQDLSYRGRQDHGVFHKWMEGQTGNPFVDANMRELKATGFMSNRGRQNVASFLVKDLQIEWRWGARYFESQLIDYDVCSNWGNWNYVAGVGNDPRENRYFNTYKQAQMYDKKGEYIRHWLPELSNVPHDLIFQPKNGVGVQLGKDYPFPLVKPKPIY